MSHFGCADELDRTTTVEQTELFCLLLMVVKGNAHWPCWFVGLADSHLDWVRPGIISYGVSPFVDKSAQELGFMPVMTLTSHLIAVRDVKAGESVGYGGNWTSERDTKVGVIAIGFTVMATLEPPLTVHLCL
ncbi:alanine racemase [Vibrio chagasii]|nr:alanine racemase [Vibrio chagasii]